MSEDSWTYGFRFSCNLWLNLTFFFSLRLWPLGPTGSYWWWKYGIHWKYAVLQGAEDRQSRREVWDFLLEQKGKKGSSVWFFKLVPGIWGRGTLLKGRGLMVVFTSAQWAVPLSTASSASNCDSVVTGLLLWATQAGAWWEFPSCRQQFCHCQ